MLVSKWAVLCGAAVLAVGVAQAESVPTLGDLSLVQSEMVLTKARVKLEEARRDLAAKRSNGSGTDDGTLPVVKSIFATDKRVVATLIYPGNVLVEAVRGDTLPGGYRVDKIHENTNKVELTKGKESFTIGFSTVVPTPKPQPGSPHAGSPVPYAPGMIR